MASRPRVLVLDDDPDILEICRELLQFAPGRPEVRTAASGPHALRLLAEEPFTALLTDLRMPGMDGVQVLAAVRREWPQVRTIVITSAEDQELRRRAHGIGVDLFCEKPRTAEEIKAFLAAVGSVLKDAKEAGAGAARQRTLQELLHLECLARNSCVIRCVQGNQEGRVWIRNGEVIDAASGDLTGQAALDAMLSWTAANYQMLPAEPGRPRRIRPMAPADVKSAQMPWPGLAADPRVAPPTPSEPAPLRPQAASDFAELAGAEGVEMVLTVRPGRPEASVECCGIERPKELGQWTSETLQVFDSLGEKLGVGKLERVEVLTAAGRLMLARKGESAICLGFDRSMALELAREKLKSILSRWAG